MLAALLVVTSVFGNTPSVALPPGRAWMPTDRLALPGYSYLAGPILETDSLGIPTMTAATVILAPFSTALTAFHWTDSVWSQRWFLDREPGIIVAALAERGEHHILWLDFTGVPPRPGPYRYIFMAQVFGDSVGPLDTVAVVHDQTLPYAAAVTPRRRWVFANEVGIVRLFASDTAQVWRQIPVEAIAWNGLTVSALDDTSVLLVSCGIETGVRWGIVRGRTWIRGGAPYPDEYAYSPVLRPRPSGGQWLAWAAADADYVGIMSYRDGVWSEPESLRCAYRDLVGGVDLSRDAGEYPAVAWFSGSVLCACMPTDSGFGEGDVIDNQGLPFYGPTVARDRNGDVWVAWWGYYRGVYWTHSYTKATAGAPRVVGAGRHRAVAWTLSEPAPESWWAVLRARGTGPFEEAARVRAGPDTVVTWADASPPAGVLRYRIRRESVDRRYEWLSEEATWPPPSRRPGLSLRIASPVTAGAEIQLSGAAAGVLALRLYDLQGRLVRTQTETASGLGTDLLRLDLTRDGLTAGMYFLRVRDSAGSATPAAKLVILR